MGSKSNKYINIKGSLINITNILYISIMGGTIVECGGAPIHIECTPAEMVGVISDILDIGFIELPHSGDEVLFVNFDHPDIYNIKYGHNGNIQFCGMLGAILVYPMDALTYDEFIHDAMLILTN